MGRPKKSQPAYLIHKPSGQARVRIDGVDVYLGQAGSPESWQKYHQLMADRSAGRPLRTSKQNVRPAQLAVAELIEAYTQFAEKNYGQKAKELGRIRSATRALLDLHGKTAIVEFSPLKLKQVIERIVLEGDTRTDLPNDDNVKRANKRDRGHRTISRTTVNDYLQVIKRVFKWGVSEELVPGSIYVELETVEGIRQGRGELAKRTHGKKKVMPAPDADVDATIPLLPPEIATMVQVQRLAGMRPDEVTIMRPCDIDRTSKPCWTFRPACHKGTWREHDRVILLGPQAIKLLEPWLKKCNDEDYLFSPQRVAARWNEEQLRKSGKESPFVKLNALRPPRACYDDHSYRQAVVRACRRAGVKRWTPGQLRHTAGTKIRAEYGLEASKIALGHRHMNTTEVYAEKDIAKYMAVMGTIG